MPVRKRSDKRRTAETLEKWECAFSCEFDYFGDLKTLGIELDEYDRPPRAAALEAWKRLGPAYLEQRDPQMGPSWAEQEFGRSWKGVPK